MVINKILELFGLVKKCKYESLNKYCNLLAIEAKASGVKVLMEHEELARQKIEGVVFMHGARAIFRDNLVIDGKVIVNPQEKLCIVSNNTFIWSEVNQQPAGQDKQP